MPPGSTTFAKLRPFLVAGAGACGGAVIYYCGFRQEEKKQAAASWTTNYTPSCKWDSNWDHRQPESLVKPANSSETDQNRFNEAVEKRKCRAVRHLLLIRHGQYDTKPKTDELNILTPLGREQAALTGLRLKELALPYSRITHSTMTRATETSRIIEANLPGVPVRSCALLEEGAPVPPEPPVGHWRPELHQFYQDGPRIEAAFRKLFHRAKPTQEQDTYEIVVCHANVIRYLVCRALQFPAEGWLRMSLNHASVTWLSVMPSGRVALRCLGDSGHMPPDKITSS